MADKIKRVRVGELAKLFDITPRHIQVLVKDGTLPKPDTKSGYDLFGCVAAYVKYQRAIINKRDEESSKGKTQKARLLELQADAKQIDNDERRGGLISAKLVEDVCLEMCSIFASGLESMPGRLSSQLAGVHRPAEIKDILFGEIRAIRQAVANSIGSLAASGGDFSKVRRPDDRSAATVPRRVGGKKPSSSGGKRRAGADKT